MALSLGLDALDAGGRAGTNAFNSALAAQQQGEAWAFGAPSRLQKLQDDFDNQQAASYLNSIPNQPGPGQTDIDWLTQRHSNMEADPNFQKLSGGAQNMVRNKHYESAALTANEYIKNGQPEKAQQLMDTFGRQGAAAPGAVLGHAGTTDAVLAGFEQMTGQKLPRTADGKVDFGNGVLMTPDQAAYAIRLNPQNPAMGLNQATVVTSERNYLQTLQQHQYRAMAENELRGKGYVAQSDGTWKGLGGDTVQLSPEIYGQPFATTSGAAPATTAAPATGGIGGMLGPWWDQAKAAGASVLGWTGAHPLPAGSAAAPAAAPAVIGAAPAAVVAAPSGEEGSPEYLSGLHQQLVGLGTSMQSQLTPLDEQIKAQEDQLRAIEPFSASYVAAYPPGTSDSAIARGLVQPSQGPTPTTGAEVLVQQLATQIAQLRAKRGALAAHFAQQHQALADRIAQYDAHPTTIAYKASQFRARQIGAVQQALKLAKTPTEKNRLQIQLDALNQAR